MAIKYDIANTDLEQLFKQGVNEGWSYDDLKKIADDRLYKASTTPGLSQYANDDSQKAMDAYLERIKPQQQTVTPVTRKSTVNDYSAYIKQMNEAARKKSLAALQSAYDQNVAALDRTKQTVAPQYEAARNQAAAQSAIAKRQFAEFAAARGLSGGTAGQAELSRSNALQENLSGINKAEASTLADLELQRSKMAADYENAIAQAQATGDYELAQKLYQEQVRQDEALVEQMKTAYQQELQERQLAFQQEQAALSAQQWQKNYEYKAAQDAASAEQQTYANKLAIAKQLAAYGDFSGYEALGIDTTQMKAAWEAQESLAQAQTAAAANKPTLTAAQTLEAIKNGVVNDTVLAAYKYHFGQEYKGQTAGGAAAVPSVVPMPTVTVDPTAEKQMQYTGGWEGYLEASSPMQAIQTVQTPPAGQPAQMTYDTLGATAKGIVDSYRRINPGTGANIGQTFGRKIQEALTSGQITEAEADYLLTMLGV